LYSKSLGKVFESWYKHKTLCAQPASHKNTAKCFYINTLGFLYVIRLEILAADIMGTCRPELICGDLIF